MRHLRGHSSKESLHVRRLLLQWRRRVSIAAQLLHRPTKSFIDRSSSVHSTHADALVQAESYAYSATLHSSKPRPLKSLPCSCHFYQSLPLHHCLSMHRHQATSALHIARFAWRLMLLALRKNICSSASNAHPRSIERCSAASSTSGRSASPHSSSAHVYQLSSMNLATTLSSKILASCCRLKRR